MHYEKKLSEKDKQSLDNLHKELKDASQRFTGYPCNLCYDYSDLHKFLNFSMNNIGDPFESSNYQINTHHFETEVLDFFAKLLNAGENYSGYVCNGGTEGNLFGIDLALQRFPDSIVYYSEKTHYSLQKIIRITRAQSILLPALTNGEMDYAVLKEKLLEHKSKSVIISVNIGTTMTGAVDNVEKVKTILQELDIKKFHIHADCALSGMILPFIDNAQPFKFSDGVHSMAISGHKFIGSPIPCGIAITNQTIPSSHTPYIAYVKIKDNTISGSRNGFTPLILWYALKRHGVDGFKQMVARCLENTEYALKRFHEVGIKAWRNPHSITVVFPKPREELITKWELASYKDIAHMIIMPHISKGIIDRVAESLRLS